MKVKITFTEPVLGTLSGNKEIAEEFIISKRPDGQSEEESQCIPEEELEKSSTIFAKTDGEPHLWNYQIEGFLKEACAAMVHISTMTKEELKKVRLTEYLYKKTVDEMIFVSPRKIFLELPEGAKLAFCERPLRAQTMRGERIALARSEMAPAGTVVNIEVSTLNPKLTDFIKKWLDYGTLKGIGQWRNSGMGRFGWELISE